MNFLSRRKFEVAGTGCGLIVGLIISPIVGGSIGIAMGGTAFAGTIPCACIGLVLFGLVGNKLGTEIDRLLGA